jgi:pimeloyl-ACP methyl ester carboxylesterase
VARRDRTHASHYRLIAPDLRGFGWTDAPDSGYDGETFARDQVALLDALELDRVKVIGHDWGGWTAFLLGLRYPERIERLLICNVPHPWPRLRPRLAAQMPMSWYAQVNAAPGLGTLAHRTGVMVKTILRLSAVGEPFSDEEIATYSDRLREPARAKGMSKLYRYYDRVFAEALRGGFRKDRLAVPTVLLFGKRDRTITYRLVEAPFDAYADEMTVEFVPDPGHFIVDERPDLVSDRALEHFSAS